MVLCHQITGFSPARLDYPLCLRVNAKFLRYQCNGSKHFMLRVLSQGRDFSWNLYYTQYLGNYHLVLQLYTFFIKTVGKTVFHHPCPSLPMF